MSPFYIDNILSDFDSKKDSIKNLTKRIESLISDILKHTGIKIHSITSRVKDAEGLRNKIVRKNFKYKTLSDITDVIGERVTVYFEEDVERVSEILKNKFVIDFQNSSDKKKSLEINEFGYTSLHLIAELPEDLQKRPDWEQFPKIKFEIQIRTILQHTWAEIEHDFGYSGKASIAPNFKRRFAILSGLLELADREFHCLKGDIKIFKDSLPNEIERNPERVVLTEDSIEHFIANNHVAKELDEFIAGLLFAKLRLIPYHVEGHVERLRFFRVNTYKELETIIEKNKLAIKKFAQKWINELAMDCFSGISLGYLYYILAAKTDTWTGYKEYLEKFKIGYPDTFEQNARRAMEIVKSEEIELLKA